ncbi:MAG: 50S ribosomal protein L21 [Chloroflexi bacterium]|nr:50S ribosomal protein L21 [Chloroflexota bacterium]
MYAIIETGGKQYKVSPGQVINVNHLGLADGSTVELEKVLFIADDVTTSVGAPFVEGAKIIATTQGEYKDKKVIVFKYKAKVRYRRKTGHRQLYTRLSIDKILRSETADQLPAGDIETGTREVRGSGS